MGLSWQHTLTLHAFVWRNRWANILIGWIPHEPQTQQWNQSRVFAQDGEFCVGLFLFVLQRIATGAQQIMGVLSLSLLSFSLRFPTDKSGTLFFALLVRLLLWISTNTRAVNHSEMPIKKYKPLFHFLESAVFRRNGKCNGGFCGFWAREEILSVIDSVGYFARAPSFESAFLKRSQRKRMSDNCRAIFQLHFAFGKYLTWNSFTEEIVNEWKSKRTKLWNYILWLMPL